MSDWADDIAWELDRIWAKKSVAEALRKARDMALEDAAKVRSETCEKCSGYGWLWAHELDHYHNPDNRDPRSDPTRYSCDGEAHKTAAAIRALKDKL